MLYPPKKIFNLKKINPPIIFSTVAPGFSFYFSIIMMHVNQSFASDAIWRNQIQLPSRVAAT